MTLSDDEREETIRVNHNSGSEHCDTCFVLGRLAEVRADCAAARDLAQRAAEELQDRGAEIARLRAPPGADATAIVAAAYARAKGEAENEGAMRGYSADTMYLVAETLRYKYPAIYT